MISNIATAQNPIQPLSPFGRQALRGQRTIIKSGLKPNIDSATVAKADSTHRAEVLKLIDSVALMPKDSLGTIIVGDSIRTLLPDSIRHTLLGEKIYSLDSIKGKDSVILSAKELRRKERKENRTPFISDSMALRKVCWASLIMPGFGQIYNKQYWKLPILYGTFGASLAMFFVENNKYKPLKKQFDAITNVSLNRTPELNSLQQKMIRHNTWREVFLVTAVASYIYFIGDAAINYSTNDVSSVARATTLATICPGAGQIYNKSYWRFPIVIGGLATTLYCIDWNNRGYQRFKKAYHLKAAYEENPEQFPNGSQDEFKGRYSGTFLKNLRNSYRRNRDLCIILTAGLYILQIVDAHVDAHLRDYDISDDLGISVAPTVNYAYNPALGYNSASIGVNLNITF